MNKVFVYGSLLSGMHNHRWLYPDTNASTKYLGEASIKGDMFDLGSFPCILDGDGVVQGEVYEVDEYILHSLDRLEGHPSFYKRKEVDYGDGVAWAYFLAHPKAALPPVKSGNWRAYYANA